jgi:hypothetical protein
MTAHAASVVPHETQWWPSRKWWAATVTALAGILGTLATTGWAFTPAIVGALITLACQRLVAYLVPNDSPARG